MNPLDQADGTDQEFVTSPLATKPETPSRATIPTALPRDHCQSALAVVYPASWHTRRHLPLGGHDGRGRDPASRNQISPCIRTCIDKPGRGVNINIGGEGMGWDEMGLPPGRASKSQVSVNMTEKPNDLPMADRGNNRIHPAGVVPTGCPSPLLLRPEKTATKCCGCYSWGGKYMSDLITHTQDLGRSVGRRGWQGGRMDGGKPRSIPSVVVVVGVGRILREPITVLKGELPGFSAAGGGLGGLLSMRIAQTPSPPGQCAGALIGRPRTGRGQAAATHARAWSLACFFCLCFGACKM